jgi:hypothetical protein
MLIRGIWGDRFDVTRRTLSVVGRSGEKVILLPHGTVDSPSRIISLACFFFLRRGKKDEGIITFPRSFLFSSISSGGCEDPCRRRSKRRRGGTRPAFISPVFDLLTSDLGELEAHRRCDVGGWREEPPPATHSRVGAAAAAVAYG